MDILNQRVNRAAGSRRSAIITGILALSLILPISTSSLWNDANSQSKDKKAKKEHQAQYEKMSDEEKAKLKAEKKAKWDAMSDEEKKAYKAQEQAKWDAMSGEEKSATMWKRICSFDNSAACIVGKKMKKHGVEAGLKAFQKMKHAEAEYVFKEKEFNSLGYAFLYAEKMDKAIAVLELNNKQYPDSWNTFDSLGEACMLAKQYDRAAKNYEMAVSMNPDGEHRRDQLNKLRTLLAGTE